MQAVAKRRILGADDQVAVKALRIALIQRGLTVRQVAQVISQTPGGLSSMITRGVDSQRTRDAIEAALGYRHPIWSSSGALAARKRCVSLLGFDPMLASLEDLRRHAGTLGIQAVRRFPGRRGLAQEVLAVVAVLPAPNSIKKP
jgi:hypothetical protein